jgi:hypothetical protein
LPRVVFSKVMRAGRARALVFALVIMVAALIASLLALAAATKPAEAAFPGTNGKIAFDRSFRIWVKNPSLGRRGDEAPRRRAFGQLCRLLARRLACRLPA